MTDGLAAETLRTAVAPFGAEMSQLRPSGAEVLDDRTIRYQGKDFMEAWTRYSVR